MSGAATIREWSRAVRKFNDDAPGQAIEIVDKAITQRLRADTGGDGALSRGRKLGRASTQTTKRKGEAEVTPSGSHGVWGILQGGTRGHVVQAKSGGMLATPYGPRKRVEVSGAPAKRTFTEGAADGIDEAFRQLETDWGNI